MNLRVLTSVVFALLLTVLASCGGSGSHLENAAASGFELTVLPESFAAGGSAKLSLSEHADGEVTVVEVRAEDAADLRAAYFAVSYDPDLWVPTNVEITDAIAAQDERLELSDFHEAGKVYSGQVAAHPETAAALTGSAVIARLSFAAGQFRGSRSTSVAPTSKASASLLNYDHTTKTLHWGYCSQGDYDQNSETNIADLTPLASRLGRGAPFDPDSADAVVNGDGNAEINIADLTPIGANLGRHVAAYNIYAGEPSDIPQSPGEASSVAPLATVPYAQHTGIASQQRLQFSCVLPSPDPQLSYWVRPIDGASEGTPSNTVRPPIVSINTPPVITSLSATPDTVASEGATSVTVAATDVNGDPLTYTWGASHGEIIGDGASVVWTAPSTEIDITAQISVFVSDGHGGSDNDVVEVLVSGDPNLPPVINTATADPNLIAANESTPLTVDATDPDGDLLQYSFSATEGTVTGTGASVVYTAPDHLAAVTVSVTVDDGDGHTVSAEIPITVTGPSPSFDEVENNDDMSQANEIDVLNFVMHGNVGTDGPNDGDTFDYFKLPAVPGDMLDITLTYDPTKWLELAVFNGHNLYEVAIGDAGQLNLKIGFKSTDPGPYYISVDTLSGTSDYAVSCFPIEGYAEVEDNDTPAQATPLPAFGAAQWTMFNGSLGSPGYDGDSVDYLGFTLAPDQDVHFDVDYDPAVGVVVAELFDSAGNLLRSGVDFGDVTSLDYIIQPTDIAPFALRLTPQGARANYWITGYVIQ
jgi:hypothetical protein